MARVLGLTLRQPWASAVVELDKDVENRTWSTPFRGFFAVHAGQGVDASAPAHVRDALNRRLPSGCIVALAELHDIVRDSVSAWARAGDYHWLLRGVRRLSVPVPCSGRQGFFTLPSDVESAVLADLAPSDGGE